MTATAQAQRPMTAASKVHAVPSVYIGDAQRTNASIRERAARLATALKVAGVAPGDAVALLARNDFVCIELALATRHLDAYVVPVNWHWQAAEVAHVLKDSGSRVVLGQREFLPMLQSIAAPDTLLVMAPDSGESTLAVPPAGIIDYEEWIARHEPANFKGSGRGSSMIYTSGTTGKPKAVRRMPAGEAEVEQRRQLLELVYNAKPGACALVTGPLYHLFSHAVAMSNFGPDASVVIMQRFDPEEFLKLVEKHRVTNVGMVPTMFVRLLRLPEEVRKRYDISSLEYVIHTAAPCPPDVKRAMIDWFGPIIWENYGCSETGVITLCNTEQWLAKPGTVGKAVLTGEVRIYDAEGKRLGPNEVGDVFMRMHGSPDFIYHGNEAAKRAIERDGFFTAGDIGWIDEDGYVFLCDRRTDMLISGGVNVYPMEIENVLLAHPEIADAAVFGIPDDEFGEVVAAHVQKVPGSMLTEQAVRDHVRASLAGYKVPRVVVFEETLPRQDNGKIYKRALREKYWAGREKRI